MTVSVHKRLGESLMSVSVHERLGDKRHAHAFCCIEIQNIVQDEDQNCRFWYS